MTHGTLAALTMLACALTTACVSNPASPGTDYSYVDGGGADAGGNTTLPPKATISGTPTPANGGSDPNSANIATPTPTPIPPPTPPVFVLEPMTGDQNVLAPAPLNFISTQQPNACLDVPNATPAANLSLGFWYCNGVGAAQAWLSGSGVLQSAGPFCLGVASGEQLVAGAHPTLQACGSNGSGVFWEYNHGQVRVTNTSLCVTHMDTVGTQVQLEACDPNNAAQGWALGANDGNHVMGMRVVNQEGGVCLDSRTANALRVTTCDGTAPQQWFWEAGYLRTQGQCLGLAADPNAVELGTCSGAATQNWYLRGNSIVNVASGACMSPTAVPAANSTTSVAMQPCAAHIEQTWVLGGTN